MIKELTAKQIEIFEMAMSYDYREGQLSENHSNLYTNMLDMSHAIPFGQLIYNHFVSIEEEEIAAMDDRSSDELVIHLSEHFINMYFDWKESQVQPVDKLSKILYVSDLKSDIDKLTAGCELKLQKMMDLLNKKLESKMKIYFVVDLDPEYDAAEQLRDAKAFDSREKAECYVKIETEKYKLEGLEAFHEIYERDLL